MIRRTTQMATVVLSNHKFPEDGQVSIPLPIPPEEYDHYMEQLDELCIGHATWRDCMVDRIDSDYPALERLQGELVNLDELDYLFQRLDSFDEHEKAAFQSVMYDRDFIDMTDLINLTFCCDTPIVITEFSALDALGKKQYSISQGGRGTARDAEKQDGRAIMERLIHSGEGKVTPYGVLYENGMKLEQCYHEGGVFPKYRYRERVMEVEISDCAEPEDTLAVSSLQLPLSQKQIEHIVERTGIQNADDIRLWFVDSILPEGIEAALSFEDESLEELNKLCEVLAKTDANDLKKLTAVVENIRPDRAFQLRQLAENIDLFDFVPNVKTAEEYGRYMIRESGHFEFDENLEGYYNYAKYGEDRVNAESGEFNIFGYVSYHGTMSLDELMAPDPAEAFDMEMGGML